MMSNKIKNLKIYIINLKKDKDRLEFQNKQFKNENLKYERVDAIYGKDLSDKERYKYSGNYFNYITNTPSIIGIFLSHLKIYKKIVNENLPYALIMEDDVKFLKNFRTKLNKLLNNLPDDYDIIHCGCDGFSCEINKKINNNINLINTKLNKTNNNNDYEKYNLIKPNTLIVGGWCYLISNKKAKEMIEKYENNISGHLDMLFNIDPNINLLLMKKPLVKHYNNLFNTNQIRKENPNIIMNSEFDININTPLYSIYNLNINSVNFVKFYLIIFIILLILFLLYIILVKKIKNKSIKFSLKNILIILVITLIFAPLLLLFLITQKKYYKIYNNLIKNL